MSIIRIIIGFTQRHTQTIVASRPVGTAMHPKAWGTHPREHKHNQRKHAASCRTSLCNNNCHRIFDWQSHSNARGLPSTALKHQTRLCAGRRYATITAAGQSIASAPEYSGTAIDSITHKKRLCATHRHATILATGHSPISRPDHSRCYSRTHQTHNAGFVRDVVKRQ